MQLARNGRTESIRPVRGHAVFVPGHSWNLPDWAHPVRVLTFLFGNKQIGVSLVRHKPGSDLPASALKANVHRSYDGLTENLLSALTIFAADHTRGPLARLLTESLLYSCLGCLAPRKSTARGKECGRMKAFASMSRRTFELPSAARSLPNTLACPRPMFPACFAGKA